MINELKTFRGNVLLVRGLPGNNGKDNLHIGMENEITIAGHLSATALNTAILQSGIIICRSGYTTIMDLVKLKQKAIGSKMTIPTQLALTGPSKP